MRSIIAFILFLLICTMFDGSFWRGIINDPHYWIPTILIIACIGYMILRFVYVEKGINTEKAIKIKETVDAVTKEEPPKKDVPPKEKVMEEKPKEEKPKGDIYHVESHGQTGGVTVGKIDKVELKVTEDDINVFEIPENLVFQEDIPNKQVNIWFKGGKWKNPTLAYPAAESPLRPERYSITLKSLSAFGLPQSFSQVQTGKEFYILN